MVHSCCCKAEEAEAVPVLALVLALVEVVVPALALAGVAGVVVQPVLTEIAVVVLAALSHLILSTGFRGNLWRMSSHRPRSPQNQATQPVPAISTSIATLIHPKNNCFSFSSGEAFPALTPNIKKYFICPVFQAWQAANGGCCSRMVRCAEASNLSTV